jgi:DNA-3-methyladenine glycosylase II
MLTDTFLTQATEHLLSCDPRLAVAINGVEPFEATAYARDRQSHFDALAGIIVGQQLSIKAAASIRQRLGDALGGELTAQNVQDAGPDKLRSLGLSGAKVNYLLSLAEHALDGQLEMGRFDLLTDEEVAREVTAVKGLGPWSADMFLMFHLQRPDILPVGDLGIREAVRRLYELEERPSPEQLQKLAEPWRPYRTVASRYLWAWLGTQKK